MIHDVMVIGAGVAGAAAAALAAARGQRVVLVERARRGEKTPPRPDWLTQPALTILDELHVSRGGWIGEPFDGAVFYPADLARSAETTAAEPPAFRVDYARLTGRLRDRAAKLGAECVYGTATTRLDAGEDHVAAVFQDRDPLQAKFVLIADGAGDTGIGEADATPRWVAEMSARVKKRDRNARMGWVLGLDGGKSLGCCWFDGLNVIVRLHAQGSRESVREQLASLVARISQRGLLPSRPAAKDADIDLRVRPAPGRLALEIDSLVDKRSLRIGDAGGFFAAASREGIFPAMWSARLAVEVLVRAADSRHPQDELRHFSTLWRTTMADYLRPPNTDLQFLLPLIFSNQQMADRLAAAFWSGQNI